MVSGGSGRQRSASGGSRSQWWRPRSAAAHRHKHTNTQRHRDRNAGFGSQWGTRTRTTRGQNNTTKLQRFQLPNVRRTEWSSLADWRCEAGGQSGGRRTMELGQCPGAPLLEHLVQWAGVKHTPAPLQATWNNPRSARIVAAAHIAQQEPCTARLCVTFDRRRCC